MQIRKFSSLAKGSARHEDSILVSSTPFILIQFEGAAGNQLNWSSVQPIVHCDCWWCNDAQTGGGSDTAGSENLTKRSAKLLLNSLACQVVGSCHKLVEATCEVQRRTGQVTASLTREQSMSLHDAPERLSTFVPEMKGLTGKLRRFIQPQIDDDVQVASGSSFSAQQAAGNDQDHTCSFRATSARWEATS